MIRKIIHIDEEKCNGCGLCASACHEGAIAITIPADCAAEIVLPGRFQAGRDCRRVHLMEK